MPLANSSPDQRLRSTSHPIVYEVNTRVLLNELSSKSGKRITLDKIPDSILDEWADLGFDAIWLMGVWTVGKLGIEIALRHEALQNEYQKILPDFTNEDVIGSPYAVNAYTVSRSIGGAPALASLRKKLAARGMSVILDFVGNHTARDHKWVASHPKYYINGNDGDEQEDPGSYFRAKTKSGDRIIAFGRDPYFPGWTDTAQLNPRHPAARSAMIDTLCKIAEHCDGVRCDMAMLLLNDVFENTWGDRAKPVDAESESREFWADAIEAVRRDYPDFLFVAEAYWNLEWPLQQLGFNFTYDKTLYDRLLREGASAVSEHLRADIAYQARSTRFIENHDEHRAAHALRNDAWHFAAATIASTVPGMLLLHEGQLDGHTIKIPVQLGRRPAEPDSTLTKIFYARLLAAVQSEAIRNGDWKLLKIRAGWHDNLTYQNIIAYTWRKMSEHLLIIVNYAPQNSQCYVELDLNGLEGSTFEFRDLMSTAVYSRDRVGVLHKGMYFDLPGYGLHIFEVNTGRAS